MCCAVFSFFGWLGKTAYLGMDDEAVVMRGPLPIAWVISGDSLVT
jgi:uncharacterized membrane protein